MALKLANLESFEAADIGRLEAAGIVTTEDVVQRAMSRAGRKGLAAQCCVGEAILLRLARMADLMRIAGINEAHTQLLGALDAGSVVELRRQQAPLLIKAMRRKNVELTLVRSVPPESNIARWISDATALPPLLEP